MERKAHWEHVYGSKATDAVSWYQDRPERSLRLIGDTGLPRAAAIIDVGGGASNLVDHLVDEGWASVTVLDISGEALAAARARLGERAAGVTWFESDATTKELPVDAYDLWHDRAVFHFLTEPDDRRAYVEAARRAVKPGGYLIIATFAEDGPTKCSGLPVVRYSADALGAEFEPAFSPVTHEHEHHETPGGAVQKFLYVVLRKT